MNELQKLPIPTIEGFHFIDISTIRYLKSDNTTTFIYVDDEKFPIVSSKNLGKYEQDLTNLYFLRVHQSYIVNLSRLKKYIRGDGTYLLLNCGTSIPVTRKEELLKFFNLLKKT
jgi:two-component system, LytTR family, response regulator